MVMSQPQATAAHRTVYRWSLASWLVTLYISQGLLFLPTQRFPRMLPGAVMGCKKKRDFCSALSNITTLHTQFLIRGNLTDCSELDIPDNTL